MVVIRVLIAGVKSDTGATFLTVCNHASAVYCNGLTVLGSAAFIACTYTSSFLSTCRTLLATVNSDLTCAAIGCAADSRTIDFARCFNDTAVYGDLTGIYIIGISADSCAS